MAFIGHDVLFATIWIVVVYVCIDFHLFDVTHILSMAEGLQSKGLRGVPANLVVHSPYPLYQSVCASNSRNYKL